MATTTTSTSNFSDLVTQLVAARAEEELRARAGEEDDDYDWSKA